MGLKNLAGKLGRKAWKHKGLALRGIKLHPAAQMVLQVKNLRPDDVLAVSGDILAQAIAELSDDDPNRPEFHSAIKIIEALLDKVVEKTDVDNKEMAYILSNLAVLYENKEPSQRLRLK